MSKLDQIRQRAEDCRTYNFGMRNADKLAHEDAPALLAALDAVLALADKWRYKGEFGWGAWQEGHGPDPEGAVLDAASFDLRAAVNDALEDQPRVEGHSRATLPESTLVTYATPDTLSDESKPL